VRQTEGRETGNLLTFRNLCRNLVRCQPAHSTHTKLHRTWSHQISRTEMNTESMEQSIPEKLINNHSASQEILRLLWNPKVHYRVPKSPPLVPIVNQVNPFHTLYTSFFNNHSNILPSTSRSVTCLFPSGFPTNILSNYISDVLLAYYEP